MGASRPQEPCASGAQVDLQAGEAGMLFRRQLVQVCLFDLELQPSIHDPSSVMAHTASNALLTEIKDGHPGIEDKGK